MKPKISALAIALLLCFSATAQSMRTPTAAEKTALMKVINPINQNFSLFLDNNWEETEGFDETAMDVPNSTRSQLRTGYLVTLKMKEGSPLYKKLMEPVLRFMKENKNDSLQVAYAAWQKQSVIHIDIAVNDGVVALGSLPDKIQKLNFPGVAKAFIVAEDNNTPRRKGAFVLAFGHWENAKYNPGNDCYNFKYVHPPGTPFIENVVIEIYGNSERINEIVKQCDWSKVTAGLYQ
jgi:hypothetical protein